MVIRQAAVAGMFYPAQSAVLAAEVDALLQQYERPPLHGLRALVVPHAGYIYSGAVAAAAYSCIARGAEYRYLLLIGPAHRVAFDGLAVPSSGSFRTPLGDYPLAHSELEVLLAAGLVCVDDRAHRDEHCLEVQLPFLQRLELDAPLLPVVVGNASSHQVAALIAPALSDPEVLTVISTDMSHYHGYEEARRIDSRTHQRILSGCTDIRGEEACGYMGLNGLLMALKKTAYTMHLLQRCNSGDSCGDHSRVVGYGAYAVY